MKKIKLFLKTKKGKISISVISTLVIITCIGVGYVYNENVKKAKALDAMQIKFKEDIKLDEFEYGSTIDVKDYIGEVINGEITGEYPKIDTTIIGEQTIKFNVSKGKYSKEIEQKVKVVDSKAPEIIFEADSKELTVGDEFDVKSNVTSVKDVVDGDIVENADAETINEKATEEYLEIKKDEVAFKDVNGESKFADHKLDDFFVETIKNEESGEETTKLILKNCYYVTGSVDSATVGDYPIKVVAVDQNGLKAEKEYVVTVKEKEVEQPVSSGGGSNYTAPNGGGGSSSTGGGSSSGSGGGAVATAPKGKDWMINYANSFVGQTGWNCQDFVDNALKNAGYLSASAPNFAYGGYDVAWTNLGPGDVVGVQYVNGQGHALMITSYPTVDEYGYYHWSTVEGGVGGSQKVINDEFVYNSEKSKLQILYAKRY